MGAIAEIFRKFGPEYPARYGDSMPANHRKVMVTFTVPQQLRRFMRSHQRIAYTAL